MESCAENVLTNSATFSPMEIEIFRYKYSKDFFTPFCKQFDINPQKYQCYGFFFSRSFDEEYNMYEANEESMNSLLLANLALYPHLCSSAIVCFKSNENFVLCGLNMKELEPICVLSPRTSSLSWGDIKTIGMAEIAKAEGLLYYGYESYGILRKVKGVSRERQRILLQECNSIVESILQ